MAESMDVLDRIADVCQVLTRTGPFTDPESFVPGSSATDFIRKNAKILVIGAGGLGCEILKNLALSGFTKITVIDMDTIDVTNLNRQFLFRASDVGKPKATVAADFINARFSHLGVNVEAIVGKIQDRPISFYSDFFMFISGLDNIAARRWLNSTLYELVRFDPTSGDPLPCSLKFMLDGGTEGLKGQARVIVPTMTACFECTLQSFPPPTNYPLCTIAETPRLPEHCIEYALLVLWPREKGDIKPNFDSPQDVGWLFDAAKARAETFGISGVTYALTLGVVKRIIPAVASTNAIISGVLVTEALKIASYANPVIDNYFMFMGQTGCYTHTFPMERSPHCLVCAGQIKKIIVPASYTLQQLLEHIQNSLNLTTVSLVGRNVLFMQKPATLREAHIFKLPLTLSELVQLGLFYWNETLTATDPALLTPLKINITEQ